MKRATTLLSSFTALTLGALILSLAILFYINDWVMRSQVNTVLNQLQIQGATIARHNALLEALLKQNQLTPTSSTSQLLPQLVGEWQPQVGEFPGDLLSLRSEGSTLQYSISQGEKVYDRGTVRIEDSKITFVSDLLEDLRLSYSDLRVSQYLLGAQNGSRAIIFTRN